MLLRLLCALAPTLLTKPQLELNLLSFGGPCSFKAAPGTRRVQAPFADPVALVLLSLRQLLLRILSERHWFVARQLTLLTFGELTFFADPPFPSLVQEHLDCKFVVGELLSSARTRAVEPLLL